MPIVIMTILITFFILISWTYHSLGKIEISKKILCIFVQLIIVFITTSITYNISKNKIQYPNSSAMGYVQNILVFLFVGINGIFVMPFFSRGIEAVYQGDKGREQLFKRAIFCAIILCILMILECGYMTSTQEGILKIMIGK